MNMQKTSLWYDENQMIQQTGDILLTITKWTKFLSILEFSLAGLMVISILISNAFISSLTYFSEFESINSYNPGMYHWSHAIILLILSCVFLIPVFYLYRFSVNIEKAVKIKDLDLLKNGFDYLKKHYIFLGTLSIIGLILFLIFFLFVLIGFIALL